MKTFFTILMFVFLSATSLFAQKDTTVLKAKPNVVLNDTPVISMVATFHDFGWAKEGFNLVYSFEFINNGLTPLVISDVQPDCHCADAKWTLGPIASKKRGRITVTIHTDEDMGETIRTFKVTSNATKPELILRTKAKIIPKHFMNK